MRKLNTLLIYAHALNAKTNDRAWSRCQNHNFSPTCPCNFSFTSSTGDVAALIQTCTHKEPKPRGDEVLPPSPYSVPPVLQWLRHKISSTEARYRLPDVSTKLGRKGVFKARPYHLVNSRVGYGHDIRAGRALLRSFLPLLPGLVTRGVGLGPGWHVMLFRRCWRE